MELHNNMLLDRQLFLYRTSIRTSTNAQTSPQPPRPHRKKEYKHPSSLLQAILLNESPYPRALSATPTKLVHLGTHR